MRYATMLLVAALAPLLAGCPGRDGQGRIVASTTVCGPMGPITGCPEYKSDPPMGGEVRVRSRMPNHQCSITSSRLGLRPGENGIRLTAAFLKLPHGTQGAHRQVQLDVDCCDTEGRYLGFTREATPSERRDLTGPTDFYPKGQWSAKPDFCKGLGLLS